MVLFLAFVLVFTVVGCSSDTDEPKNTDTTQNVQDDNTKETTGEVSDNQENEDEDTQSVPSEGDQTDGKYFDNVFEFAELIKEIKYTINATGPNGQKMSTTTDILYEGKETVDGVKANKYHIDGTTGDMDIYVTDEREFIKVNFMEQEFDSEMAETFFTSNFNIFISSDYWDGITESNIVNERTEKKDLGDGTVTITYYDVEYGGGKGTIGFSKLDGRNFFIGFNSDIPGEGSGEMVVTKLILR